jgi:hypothetical protein
MKTKYLVVAGLLVAFLFGAASSLFPSEPCKNWDARGSWKIRGQLREIDMHLDQSGTTISGRATSKGDVGDVVGNIRGDALGFQIKWSTGAVATFWGDIQPYNPIKGSFIPAAMQGYKGATYNWSADRAMPCADSAPPAVTAPAGDSAPVSGHGGFGPAIGANPNVVTILPGQNEGSTTLSWNGGGNHPQAHVWVKVNGRDKKFVAGESRGTLQLPVKPGKTYLYILTDSGQQLASVTVKAEQQENMRHHHKNKSGGNDDNEN